PIPSGPGGGARRRRPLVLVAFTAVAAITLVVSALLLLTGNPRVSLARTGSPRAGSLGVGRHVVQSANASAPVEWILLVLAILALAFAAWLWSGWGRSRPPAAAAHTP